MRKGKYDWTPLLYAAVVGCGEEMRNSGEAVTKF